MAVGLSWWHGDIRVGSGLGHDHFSETTWKTTLSNECVHTCKRVYMHIAIVFYSLGLLPIVVVLTQDRSMSCGWRKHQVSSSVNMDGPTPTLVHENTYTDQLKARRTVSIVSTISNSLHGERFIGSRRPVSEYRYGRWAFDSRWSSRLGLSTMCNMNNRYQHIRHVKHAHSY
jgi:hypothetical protein